MASTSTYHNESRLSGDPLVEYPLDVPQSTKQAANFFVSLHLVEQEKHRRTRQIKKQRKRLRRVGGCMAVVHLWCLVLARSFPFKVCSFLLIVTNTVVSGVVISNKRGAVPIAEFIDSYICGLLLLVEVTIRLLGSMDDHWWQSGWLVMDVLLVAMELTELALRSVFVRWGIGDAMRVLSCSAVLRLVRLIRYGHIIQYLRPLRVLVKALGGAYWNVFAVMLYTGTFWLVLSILLTATVGRMSVNDALLKDVISSSFSTVPRSLGTIFKATFGGMKWGTDLVDPMLKVEAWESKLGGVGICCCILATSFCLWNLVLGIYVRQVTAIGREYDVEVETRALRSGENAISRLRDLMEEFDLDNDGCISPEELKEGIQTHAEELSQMGISGVHLLQLHGTLDANKKGHVDIGEFLIAVLKKNGASKTIDMLSIDFRQKSFLRNITRLEQQSETEMGHLTGEIDQVAKAAEHIACNLGNLKNRLLKAKSALMDEIDKEDNQYAANRRQAMERELLENVHRKAHTLKVKEGLQDQLMDLRREVTRLASGMEVAALDQGRSADVATLRAVVRTKLTEQLTPWLRRELMEAAPNVR